jgi:hypothetical protein
MLKSLQFSECSHDEILLLNILNKAFSHAPTPTNPPEPSAAAVAWQQRGLTVRFPPEPCAQATGGRGSAAMRVRACVRGTSLQRGGERARIRMWPGATTAQ